MPLRPFVPHGRNGTAVTTRPSSTKPNGLKHAVPSLAGSGIFRSCRQSLRDNTMAKYFITKYHILLDTVFLRTNYKEQFVKWSNHWPKYKDWSRKNISTSEFSTGQEIYWFIKIACCLIFYGDDKLKISLKEQDNRSTVFKSFYFGNKDIRYRRCRAFWGTGFSIKIVNDKAMLYHMLTSDDFLHTLNAKGQFDFRLWSTVYRYQNYFIWSSQQDQEASHLWVCRI